MDWRPQAGIDRVGSLPAEEGVGVVVPHHPAVVSADDAGVERGDQPATRVLEVLGVIEQPVLSMGGLLLGDDRGGLVAHRCGSSPGGWMRSGPGSAVGAVTGIGAVTPLLPGARRGSGACRAPRPAGLARERGLHDRDGVGAITVRAWRMGWRPWHCPASAPRLRGWAGSGTPGGGTRWPRCWVGVGTRAGGARRGPRGAAAHRCHCGGRHPHRPRQTPRRAGARSRRRRDVRRHDSARRATHRPALVGGG